MKNIFRYMLYLILSFGFGYASFKCGPNNDYLGKLSSTLLSLLTTILVLYTTLSNLVLGQMQKYQEKHRADLKPVLSALRRNVYVEFSILALVFLFFIGKGLFLTYYNNKTTTELLSITNNAITFFALFYFLYVIYDSTMSFYDAVEENDNSKNDTLNS